MSIPTNTLSPFSRQFTSKLLASAVSIAIALFFIVVLFWQHKQQTQSIIQNQLLPLQQQVQQLESLQQAKLIVDELLRGDSEQNWLKLHSDLIALNQQLLRRNSNHVSIYQQWLNQNKVAIDVVERAEKNKSRNQQLKQSSVIQLQLMLFSVTSISDIKSSYEQVLYQQLQLDKSNDTVTLNRANAYAKAVKRAHKVKQLKSLLAELLTSFERLTIMTPQADFDLLRLGVEQLFAQTKLLQDDNTKAISEFLQQTNSFRGIVLTEQMALAKWQGYLRLMQSYNIDLSAQKLKIATLLSKSHITPSVNNNDPLGLFLANNNIPLTSNEITAILMLAFAFALAVLCVVLWKIKQQINFSSQQSLALIEQSIQQSVQQSTQGNGADVIEANCFETAEVIRQIQLLATPEHNEQDYQVLQNQVKANELFIEEQKQAFELLAESSDVQQLEKFEQVAEQFNHELQRYDYLKSKVLSQLVQQQISFFSHNYNHSHNKDTVIANDAKDTESAEDDIAITTSALNRFYDKLELFELASYLQSNNALLTLSDVHLLEELHGILLNKKVEQSTDNNQLFISYDEQIMVQYNVDIQLFQHLFNLLVDISLQQCHGALFHLHLQVQDKNAGQQVIRFVAKVCGEGLINLPATIKQLAQASEKKATSSSLAEAFKILLVQLHGKDFVAQLIDGGYQLSFDMPLAIANTAKNKQLEKTKEADNVALAEVKVMLLTTNNVIASIIAKRVVTCAGKFEVIARIDSFSQLISVKNLRRCKLDLLMVTSDIAVTELSLIEQQIASLPETLQPKLMVLQSSKLSVQKFGFYSQAEQPLCKTELLDNIKHILAADEKNNQLLSADAFQHKSYMNSELQVLLAVRSPQQYQVLQRLLQWLGLRVQFVCNETSQAKHWQTGRYCLLITEFTATVWLNMTVQPLTPIGVFSLSELIAPPESTDAETSDYFAAWHYGQLTSASSLAELEHNLLPWLKKPANNNETIASFNKYAGENRVQNIFVNPDINEDELIINEVAACLTADANSEAAFDFSRYLQHQGSVELALFMLDDYSQDNHQQLACLATAIKDKDLDKAIMVVNNLQLNGKILAADDLQQLCRQWLDLLSKGNALTQLKQVNALLKDTQQVLHAVDSYAQTI
ncbi:hypothetical protein A9Q74_12355 [Colwellia sp. 39_35_sub15_T18]|nr:hypothetical protein A9Q74_12355 [Colwellia sp. 39_35_sub15_T18]